MRKLYFKVLIISVLCLFIESCKSKSNTTKKNKIERTDTTDDVRDDQMDDYEEEMRQQNNQEND
jgi:hypothetical protein